jgi:hypothetical protein
MGTDGGDGCSTLWLSVGGEILSKCVCVWCVSVCVYACVCVSVCVYFAGMEPRASHMLGSVQPLSHTQALFV